jgi:hypothetical protein
MQNLSAIRKPCHRRGKYGSAFPADFIKNGHEPHVLRVLRRPSADIAILIIERNRLVAGRILGAPSRFGNPGPDSLPE